MKIDFKQQQILLEQIKRYRPLNRRQIAAYAEAFLHLKLSDKPLCPEHQSPLDYLSYSLLNNNTKDIVVWANRGGGKTQLAAAASLLECYFMPLCQVRILGGSQQQSQRMYEYVQAAIEENYSTIIAGKMTQNGCRFNNGSSIQALTQSQSSVRGHHIQRLRCDEVEMFDADVWQAAQFVTQSKNNIAGRLEIFSTMHKPFGLMQKIVSNAQAGNAMIFKWCLFEVIEKCVDHNCSSCILLEDCQGRAKNANGYYRIDDAIAQKRRASNAAWQSEMLCRKPQNDDMVFAEFDSDINIAQVNYQAGRETFRTIDFGFSNPFACLLIQIDSDQRVLVLDEYIKSRTTVSQHAKNLKELWPWPISATYCDPAGRQRNEITGHSAIDELANFGIVAQSRPSRIVDGIELMRQWLRPASGPTKLIINPKCRHLIEAMQNLRFGRSGGVLTELPEKDGVNDHIIDALRYFFINQFGQSHKIKEKRY